MGLLIGCHSWLSVANPLKGTFQGVVHTWEEKGWWRAVSLYSVIGGGDILGRNFQDVDCVLRHRFVVLFNKSTLSREGAGPVVLKEVVVLQFHQTKKVSEVKVEGWFTNCEMRCSFVEIQVSLCIVHECYHRMVPKGVIGNIQGGRANYWNVYTWHWRFPWYQVTS